MNCSLTSPRAKLSRAESVLTIFVSKPKQQQPQQQQLQAQQQQAQQQHVQQEVEEEEVEEGRPKRRELHNI